jgi:hypothetical protein
MRLTKAQVSRIYELSVERALDNVQLEAAELSQAHGDVVVMSGWAYGEEGRSESYAEWLVDGDGEVLSGRGGGAEKQEEREEDGS